MKAIDIFSNDPFRAVHLTETVNGMEYVPSFARDLGLHEAEGVPTTTVGIPISGDSLSLVPITQRGESPTPHAGGKRELIDVRPARLATWDTLTADQIRDVLGADMSNLEGVQEAVKKNLLGQRRSIDLTEENHFLASLFGEVRDSDGSVAFDAYTKFQVSKPAQVNLALTTADTDVKGKVQSVKRTMFKNAGDMRGAIRRVHALCAHDAFDALASHAQVVKANEQRPFLREGQALDYIDFAGVRFWDYPGSDLVSVADGKIQFFPEGPGFFKVFYSPADTLETISRVGLPRYAFQAVDPVFGQHVNLSVQTNVLPLCLKPATLIPAKMA